MPDDVVGSPTHNLRIPLIACGLGLLVGLVAHLETASELKELELDGHRRHATTLANAWSPAALNPNNEAVSHGGTVDDQAFHRALPGVDRVTCVVYEGGRTVVRWSTSENLEPLPAGTPLPVSERAHRAFRSKTTTVEMRSAPHRQLVAYAPLRNKQGEVGGLLILEVAPASSIAGFLNPWSLLVLPFLLAGGLGLWYSLRMTRSMATIREHLQALNKSDRSSRANKSNRSNRSNRSDGSDKSDKPDKSTQADRANGPEISDNGADPAGPATVSDVAIALGRLSDQIGHDRSLFDARVRQRTAELEESAKAKDEVIANIVHELRTPLSTIMASVDILKHTRPLSEDERNEFLDQANTASQHMKFLVNDILDSAAVESGMMRVEAANCSLNQILRDAERVMQPNAIAKCIELRLELPDHEIGVNVDRGRVLQVLFNLVSNAVKYSPQGSAVSIRAVANSLAAVVEVEDSGDGVPASSRARLFTKFARLHRNNGQEVEGSGIGLYLSKKLVELMHGSIGYRDREEDQEEDGEDTAPDGGSVFWFTLPLADEPLNGTQREAATPVEQA